MDKDEAELQFASKILNDLRAGRSYIPRAEKDSSSDMNRNSGIELDFTGTGAAATGYNPMARPGVPQVLTGVNAKRNVEYRAAKTGRTAGKLNPRYTSFQQPHMSKLKTPFSPSIESPGDEEEMKDLYKHMVGRGKFKEESCRYCDYQESLSDEELLQRWRDMEAGVDGNDIQRGWLPPGAKIKNSIVGKRMSPEDQENDGFPQVGFHVDKDAVYQTQMSQDQKKMYDENPELSRQHFIMPAQKAIRAMISRMGLPIDRSRIQDLVDNGVGDVAHEMGQWAHLPEFQSSEKLRMSKAMLAAGNYLRQITNQETHEKSGLAGKGEDSSSPIDTATKSGINRLDMDDREKKALDKEDSAVAMLGNIGIERMADEDKSQLLQAIKNLKDPASHKDAVELLATIVDAYGEEIPALKRTLDDIMLTAKKQAELDALASGPIKKSVEAGDEPLYYAPSAPASTPVKAGSMMDRLRARRPQ
jgi:hypothetical protein